MSEKLQVGDLAGRPLPASKGLLAGYCAMAAATCVAVLAGGTQRTGVALGLLAVAAFVIAVRVTAPVALASGAMGWLFYSGFITGRHGDLAWHGAADVARLGILLGAALCGFALCWADRHRAAAAARLGDRLREAVSLQDRRDSAA